MGRSKEPDALAWKRAFGDRVRNLKGHWDVAVAVASADHARATGLGLKSALMTDHGGGKIYFAIGHPDVPLTPTE